MSERTIFRSFLKILELQRDEIQRLRQAVAAVVLVLKSHPEISAQYEIFRQSAAADPANQLDEQIKTTIQQLQKQLSEKYGTLN